MSVQNEQSPIDGEQEDFEEKDSETQANVCTPGDEKCESGVKLKCKSDGAGWFKVGYC